MGPQRLLFPTGRDLPPSPLRRVADALLNLIYPESCFVCLSPVFRVQDCGVCDRCWGRALQLRIMGAACPSCGLPFATFENEAAHLCGRCTVSLPPFSGARSFGWYGAELSRMIQALKFQGRRRVANLLAPLLASTLVEWWPAMEIDLVVPVPLHPRRQRERGYNQAVLLGRPLARLVGLPFRGDLLIRTRATSPQVGLTDAERARNLRHAFRCIRPEAVRGGLRLLLIDDVMTTGATAASASEALLEAGASRVSVLTAARTAAGTE